MGVLLQVASLPIATWLLWKLIGSSFRGTSLDNIPGPKPASFLLGHFDVLMSKDYWAFLQDISRNYGGIVKLQELFGRKFLYVADPAALHTMFVKEPNNFEESSEFLIGNRLLFGPGLASASGEMHRKQRKLLNPAFAPAHLREIAPVFFDVANTMCDAIAEEVTNGQEEVNMAAWTGRGALEIVGQSAMGYSFDQLKGSVSNEYAIALRSLMPTVFSIALHWFFVPWSIYLGPPKFRRWLLDFYPFPNAQKLKNIVNTVWDRSVTIVDQHKAALLNGDEAVNERVGGGKDIISILLRANMQASEEDRLPDEQLTAQVNTLIFAASDTTSNGLARVLHTLAENQDVQERLRKEINDIRKESWDGEELTYERLCEMPFLDAVVRETLRVYPPVLSMDRVALCDTVLPLSKPITDTDGKTITEVLVTKDTTLNIGIYTFNRSKDLWGEDAEDWKPERWLKPLPDTIKNSPSGAVFGNLMTFAGGPRSCIGFKYAELEIKAFLFHLVERFKFTPATSSKIIWNTSFVVFPSVTKDSSKAEMPLKVEIIRSTA
ncbi:cytochrome P450 [Cristinia sonorae]|uniref:Cytochrome P450 n=1 Tax=Cristinia sonorae TaxID=1940300 RepID=A0A8K0UVT3_9AGAR|nr:cytochrome P450 [Cristinia sonorae]